jgi:hypothetical protein
MSTPIWATYKKESRSTSINYFKETTWAVISIDYFKETTWAVISNMSSNLHQAHLKSCAGPHVGTWLFFCPIILCFYLPSKNISFTLQTKLGLPSFDSWSNPLHLWSTISPFKDLPPLLCPWWGKNCIPCRCLRCFCIHCKRCNVSQLARTNQCFFSVFPLVFSSMN